MDTHDSNLCIHCNSTLTPRDLAEGWCDACGKRLPTTSRPKAASAPAAAAAPARGGKRWLYALAGVAVAVLGAAAAFAAAR